MTLSSLFVLAGMAVAEPIGPVIGDSGFDLDGAVGQLVSADDDAGSQWSIPDFDDPEDDGPEGAQLRLRLLKLKLKVPI